MCSLLSRAVGFLPLLAVSALLLSLSAGFLTFLLLWAVALSLTAFCFGAKNVTQAAILPRLPFRPPIPMLCSNTRTSLSTLKP